MIHMTGWWFRGHPSEKYDSIGMIRNSQYFWENKNGNQTTNQHMIIGKTRVGEWKMCCQRHGKPVKISTPYFWSQKVRKGIIIAKGVIPFVSILLIPTWRFRKLEALSRNGFRWWFFSLLVMAVSGHHFVTDLQVVDRRWWHPWDIP